MKHSSTRDLYDYWNERRGPRGAPERAEIDPTAIPRVLADTFLLGMSPGGDMAFRLAGTRVCALFCRELKGQSLVPLFRGVDRTAVRDLISVVSEEATAAVAGLTGQIGDGVTAELELLLLPLSHRGRTDTRILGVLAPITRPYWLGMMPIEALAVGALRYLGRPERDPRSRPSVPLVPMGRLRHGLIVYDGGRP